jgi:peptide/nickel transport system ATP-binding protein/oligopeptide transport system ATP-binding protein
MSAAVILSVRQLRKRYRVKREYVDALDGVDLEIERGETVAIVGESGSGKTTLGRLILGLEPPTSGEIEFEGALLKGKRSGVLRRRIQVVQQNPFSTLNPKRTVGAAIELPLRVHKAVLAGRYKERVKELLDIVGMPPSYMNSHPAALSGGQRQRVALARALASEPDLIVLDEPTSALDVSVQARVLGLLVELQKNLGLTYIFITHDLSVVKNIATRVSVMYRGRIVEHGPTNTLFSAPRHRYTNLLLSSIPVVSEADNALKPSWDWDLENFDEETRRSDGCSFAPRCPFAADSCWSQMPALERMAEAHFAACHKPADAP